jgi:hypothetical protein
MKGMKHSAMSLYLIRPPVPSHTEDIPNLLMTLLPLFAKIMHPFGLLRSRNLVRVPSHNVTVNFTRRNQVENIPFSVNKSTKRKFRQAYGIKTSAYFEDIFSRIRNENQDPFGK